jgi:hypothetical protein
MHSDIQGHAHAHASNKQAHAHTYIGGAAAHNGRAALQTGRAHPPERAESGAYRSQVRDGGGVPRADVRVEGRRRLERLRADDAQSTAA